MAITLFELALADVEIRPSPYCWRVRFALLHKGLPFETEPLRFAEKQNYPVADHVTVPVLRDGEQLICDSESIIAHLEKNYGGPAFAQSDGERAAAAFYNAWLGAALFPALAPMLFPRVYANVHEDDRAYFRKSREKRLGKTLEEFGATPGCREKAEAALQTLSAPLTRFRFLGGDEANISDYTVFSVLMWARLTTSEALFEAPQPVEAWSERMLDLFDGHARKAKRVS